MGEQLELFGKPLPNAVRRVGQEGRPASDKVAPTEPGRRVDTAREPRGERAK